MPLNPCKASLRDILAALETDICEGLIELRSRGYSVRHAEIMDALKRANLSKDTALAFAAHVLLRFDDARRVIDGVTRFEPVIKHKLNIDRKNRESAQKVRARPGKDLRKEIKYIMRREKKRDIAFVDFCELAMEGHIEGLTMKKMRTGKYKLFTDRVSQSKAIKLQKNTLSRWYYAKKK